MPNAIKKHWKIYPKISADANEKLKDYPPVFRQILFNRGITDWDSAQAFLKSEQPVFPPGSLLDIDKAVDLIAEMAMQHKRIVVFGDYDVDGVTSTVVLVQLLQKVGVNVEMYIPNRFEEGYGFSMDALTEVLQLKPDLIITVDCGVRSIQEVRAAGEQVCG